jgi:hypothetical protein
MASEISELFGGGLVAGDVDLLLGGDRLRDRL